MKCPLCGLENPESAMQCDCGYYFIKPKETTTKTTTTTTDNSQSSFKQFEVKSHFKTLLAYGNFTSGFGWVIIFLGIIGIIGGLASGKDIGFGIAVGGIFIILSGLSMIILGQLISCFVSIERNTRVTYELLQAK